MTTTVQGAITTAQRVFWDNDGIADRVWDERQRQLNKWGLQTRPSGTSAMLWKERELLAKRDYEEALEAGELTWLHILREEVYEAFAEEDPAKLEVELEQVMAVAASWLQDMRLKGEVPGEPVNYITGHCK